MPPIVLSVARIFLLVLTMAALSAPAAATYLNGQIFSQTLNARQLPDQLKTAKPGGATAVWQTYTYDARRKIDAITDGVSANESRDYDYDGNGRLVSATGPWGTGGAQAAGSYLYDALGNVRSWTQGTKTGTVSYGDAANRVTAYAKTGAATRSFTYDARGNTTDNGDYAFVYDFANQPVAVGGAIPATHEYDGNFKRVKTVENGKTVYQVFSRVTGGLIYRDEATDGERTDYVSVGGAALRLKKTATLTPEYVHFDHQGSAVAATNASGAVLWRERYSPWGTRLLKPAGNKGDTGYTGHLMDNTTELVYMQARYYDSQIQRFYSTDPVGYQDQLNLYAYVGNDPVNKIDPTGEESGCIGNGNCSLGTPGGDIGKAAAVTAAIVLLPLAAIAAPEIAAAVLAAPATATEVAVAVGEVSMGDAAGAGIVGAAIHGTAQVTKAAGEITTHASTSARVAGEMSQSGKFTSVHMNQKASTITDGAVKSGVQPDVAGVLPNGKVDVVEVLSGTQTAADQSQKNVNAFGDKLNSVVCVKQDGC